MNKFILTLAILIIASLSIYLVNQQSSANRVAPNANIINNEEEFLLSSKQHPLTIESLKKGQYPGVNPEKIGMWGHSLGGFLTLRSMVVSKDIKAGVIWAGVVGSYPDLLRSWRRRGLSTPPAGLPSGARRWRDVLVEQYGTPEVNPTFWNSISANSYLSDISGPLQLHHGTGDTSVPSEFSQKLTERMKEARREVELFIYPGDDHNLASNFATAMQRSVEFFEKYLKN